MHKTGDDMKLEYNKGVLFIRFIHNIDHSISYKINNYLVPKILTEKIKYIVFNLYEVNDIDEFGLDALLNTKCAIKTNKGKICLCEVSDNLNKKIKKIKMKKVNNEIKALDLIGAI
jgi:anti-anti-sigma factor